jgi:hypothetical protein
MPYTLSDAQRLRALLVRAGYGHHAAALELDIDQNAIDAYCAGDAPVPRVVMMAVERLVDRRKEQLFN